MIGPEITVPDVTEAVVGYRQFALVRHQQHNFQLVSPHQGEPWQTVEKTAKCMREITVPEGIVLPRPPKPHKAPHKGCGCGIYVYFDPNPVGERRDSMLMHPFGGPSWAYANKVQALMSLSGTIEVHSRGMRAERGRICAFGDNAQLANDERAALHELARQFGVPVVPESELPKLSTEYGRPLDKTLRPEPEPTLQPKALSYEWGATTPARRRRRWTAFIPSGINGSAAALNFTLTAIHFAPLSLGCAAASTAMAVLMYPKDKS